MLNLLNVIFVIFYGYFEVDDRYTNFEFTATPQITLNEIRNVDGDIATTELILDTNYFLTIDSSDFENGTGYTSQLVYNGNEQFMFDNITSAMIDNLSIYIEYYDFDLVYGVRNNLSFIDIFYFQYIEISVTCIDGSSFGDYREVSHSIHLDTNFTINNRLELQDYTNFHIKFTYDFIDTYADGYDVGYDDGYDNGFGNGEDYGYEQGYKQGYADIDKAFNGSWVEWLGTAVTGFFALEIFPGFTLAGALGAVVAAYLMMWILKVLAGG